MANLKDLIVLGNSRLIGDAIGSKFITDGGTSSLFVKGDGTLDDSTYLTQTTLNSGNPDLAAIEALSGTSGLLKKTAADTWTLDTNAYLTQATFNSGNPGLAAIEALSGTSGILKKTANNTWVLDTNTYLTSYTETDPTVPSHVKAITSLNISDWNGKLDEAYYVVNVTSDSQIIPPSIVSGSSNYYFLDIVTAYNNGRIPIVILNQELILPFIASNQTIVLFGTTVNLYSYLITIDEDSVEIKSLIGISEEDIPITQIQINGSTLIPDSQVVDITSIPASIVTQNSSHRFVTDNEKSKINSAIQGVKVNGTSITPDSNKIVDITVPNELSSTYQRSILENEDLVLEVGDSYEEAFGKLEKAIIDDEETVAAALNELNDKIKDVDTELDEESENPVQNKAITQAILDNEYVVSVALNNLNDRIQAKLDTLISGTNIKTINGTSILGSGNINVSGGSGTGGGGDENIIETVKVNGTALTPDANKAVNITSIPASIVTQDVTHRFVSDTEKTTWNGKLNALQYYTENSGNADIDVYSNGEIELACLDDVTAWNRGRVLVSEEGVELNYKDGYAGTDDEIEHTVTLNHEGFKFDNKQIATVDQIPSAVTESTVSGWGFTKNTGTYSKPSTGIPNTDLASAVQTSLGKADTAIQGVKVNGTALTPDANKAVDITVPTTLDSISDGTTRKLSNYLPLSGGTMTGAITVASGDGKGLLFSTTSNINVSGTTNTILGFYNGTYIIGHTSYPVNIRGNATRPLYNGNQLALYSDIPSEVTESTVSGWGFTKNTGTVTGIKMNGTTNNPTSGIVDLGTVITSETSLSKGTTSGSGNAVTDISVSGHTITLTKGSTFLTSETSLSKGTTSGSGNAVTDISVSGHTITLTKGSTFLTSHQNIKTINNNSLVGTGNVTINELPTVTSSDNGKILQVVNGAWALVTPTAIYSGTSTPNNSTGNDGDLYLQTS